MPLGQILLFKAKSEELKNTRLLRRGFHPSVTLHYERMRGLRFETTQPDEDDLRSFLLTFRHFVSDKEPVHLYRIYNLCQQHIRSEALRSYLTESREHWKRLHQNSGIRLVFNERVVTPEEVMDLWINGHYFHNDYHKYQTLTKLLPHELIFVRFHFLNFLIEATRQILYVANVITVALKEGLITN